MMLEYLIRFFYPPKCVVCDEPTGYYSDFPYCKRCYDRLKTAKYFEASYTPLDHVDKIYIMYSYHNESTRYSVFHAKKYFTPMFYDFYKEQCKEISDKYNIAEQIDLITFSTRRKSEKRIIGFDQAEEMAKAASEAMNKPFEATLVRTRKSKKQRRLNRINRAKNVRNLFRATHSLDGKRILLTDDVITTGSTLSDCARALKEAGAESVYLLVFASN